MRIPGPFSWSLSSSPLLAVGLVGCLLAGACEIVGPSNAFDPAAPLETQARARIEVTVVDIAGDPLIEGVTVVAQSATGDVPGVVDDGVFAAADLLPGSWTVIVSSAQYTPVTRDIVVGAGVTRALDVVLAPLPDDAAFAGTITGTARKESQVTVEAADHSGVIVEVFDGPDSTGIRAVTNALGRYDIVILPGRYSLAFSAPEHEPQTRDNVDVAAGRETANEPVTLEVNPGSIDGVVTLEDLDATDDVAPSPAGATIALVGGAVTTTAAADGSYRITGLPPGNQALRFSFADHVSVEVPVLVRSGSTAPIAGVTLQRARGVVFGVVEVAGAADGSGVLVEAEGSGVVDVTGLDGAFSLTLPTGTWDIVASRPGSTRARAVVTVAAGAAVDADVLTLNPNVGVLEINGGDLLTNDAAVVLGLDEPGASRVRASEDPTLLTGTIDVAYPADGRVPFTLSAGDGVKSIFVQVEDGDGELKSLSGTITLDTTAPTVDSVVVDDGDGITPSLSITVSVLSDDAEEMAVATDGAVDSELFSPFAPVSIALLPAVDGEKTVCVVVRDRADNRAPPLCTTVILESSIPATPNLTVNGVLADDMVISPETARNFRIGVIPFSGDSADVDFVEGTITSQDAVLGIVSRDVLIDCETVSGAALCGGPLGVPLALFFAVNAGDEVRPNLIQLRARDIAGNVSSEASLLVVVDDKAPKAPTPTNARCATPGPLNSCPARIYETNNVNADSFTLRLREVPIQIDRTFNEYRVAQTVGADVDVTDADFAPTASVDNIVFALTQGAPLNGLPPSSTCNPLRCTNHLFLLAIDQAGNRGPLVRIDVVEDSSPPTRPTVAPRGGIQRGDIAELRLVEPARDRDGAGGADEVFAYEIKEGIDGAFEGVPDGQPVAGPWSLGVLTDDVSEVCVRGVDAAGNVGIEDCVLVEEQTTRHPVRTEVSDRRVALAGDTMVVQVQQTVLVRNVGDEDLTSSDDIVGGMNLNNVGRLQLAARFDNASGDDVVDLLVDHDLESSGNGTQSLQFFPGVTSSTQASARRNICGLGADTDGATLVFARGTRIVQATRAQAEAVAANNNTCDNTVGTVIADVLPAAGLCAETGVRVQGNVMVWCEGNGVIKRRTNSAAAVILSSAGAAVNQGVLSPSRGLQQPLVTTTATYFAQATGSNAPTIRRVVHGSTTVVDTGIAVGGLQDAEGDTVVYQALTSGGVSVDIAVVDTAIAGAQQRLLTNDLAPQGGAVIDSGRVAFTDLASLTEDIALVDLTTSRWLSATSEAETFPVIGDGVATWVTFDGDVTVRSRVEDLAAGTAREVELVRINLLDLSQSIYSFFGGTILGPPTLSAGGRSVFLLKQNAATFALRAIDVDVNPVAPALLGNLRAINSSGGESAAAYGLSADARALVFVDDANNLRFNRLSGTAVQANGVLATFPAVNPQNLTTVVPFVDVELSGANGITVAQVGNSPVGGFGDDRRSNVGNLTCYPHSAAGVLAGPAGGRVITRGGVALAARAPAIATVGALTFMAYQDVVAGQNARNHVCQLTCNATTATCTNDVAIGKTGDGQPRISRTGLVAFIGFDRTNAGDVVLYDVATNRQRRLTGEGGDEPPRDLVEIFDDRVIWSDARLGTFDLWEANIER